MAALGDRWNAQQQSPCRTRCIIAQCSSSSRVSQVCHFILLQQGLKKGKANEAKVERSDWQRAQPLGAVNLTRWMECLTNPQDLFHASIWGKKKAHREHSEMEGGKKTLLNPVSSSRLKPLTSLVHRLAFETRFTCCWLDTPHFNGTGENQPLNCDQPTEVHMKALLKLLYVSLVHIQHSLTHQNTFAWKMLAFTVKLPAIRCLCV